MRYIIQLNYDGTDFFGWQKQPKHKTVQGEIETCLTRLNSNEPIEITGCGRTDTGVHAQNYIAHFDCEGIDDPEQWLYKLNKMLPAAIAIQSLEVADDDFHARFDAKRRTYHYHISTEKNVFRRNHVWYFPFELDLEAMNNAGKLLLGQQDFSAFAKTHTDVKTHICNVFEAKWVKTETGYQFTITADRFLRNMVRAIVSTLVDVGLGKINVDSFAKIIASKERSEASASAPASGLFLSSIEY